MNPPPVDGCPKPASYRDLLIVRTSVPCTTLPSLREFISSRALVVFFIACDVALPSEE
jgi:hypothetical protein